MPPAAGFASAMLKFACSAGATVTFAGKMMSCQFSVTLAVVWVNSGKALARITDVPPGATGVTATFAVVAPATKFTVAGTVTTPVFVETRFTVSPPNGAGPESVNVRLPAARSSNVRVGGVKLSAPIVRAVCDAAV